MQPCRSVPPSCEVTRCVYGLAEKLQCWLARCAGVAERCFEASLKPQAGCFKLPISVSMQPFASTTAELQSARKCSSGLHSTAQQAVASLEQGDESRLSVRAGSPLRRRG